MPIASSIRNPAKLLAAANAEITGELLETLREADVKTINILYINDLDQGPYISNTLNIDPTSNQLEALGRNLPDDAPG